MSHLFLSTHNWALYNIISGCVSLIFATLCGWIAFKVYSNLYQREYNWIISPSSSNKIYALLTTTISTLSYIILIANAVLLLMTNNSYIYAAVEFIYSISKGLSRFCYFLYMISNLEYHMDADLIFADMISSKIIKLCKFVLYYGLFQNTIYAAMYIAQIAINNFQDDLSGKINGFPYQLVFDIANLVFLICAEATSFYLYYSGLNNLCRYLQSKKRWEEDEEYEDNDRIHEILIVITRSFIGLISSGITTLFYIICLVVVTYLFDGHSIFAIFIVRLATRLLSGIDDFTCCLSVYLIYPFSYECYRRICGGLHDKIYDTFYKRHQRQMMKSSMELESSSDFYSQLRDQL